MPYLNVPEIETWTELAALANPALCTRVALPLKTPDLHTCHVVRIRAGSRVVRHGLLLMGNQHAREWGSSDILVNLADRLMAAYKANQGLSFMGKSFTSAEIKYLLENLDIFVFPCVNPDGRAFSQAVYPMWRQNRRPTPGTSAIGTDLNRNYDLLWDFKAKFAPNMWGYQWPHLVVSDDPVNELFHGTAPFSEPETKNVLWLLDANPHIRFLVDVHCYTGIIAYPWGHVPAQPAFPEQNFLNAAYDGIRGTTTPPTYGEFMRLVDSTRMNVLATRMNQSLFQVRGITYQVGPSVSHPYPTCGSAPCYAFSRHIADSAKGKIDSFLIEWGTSFQPPYDTEMLPIFEDVGAALTELGRSAAHVPMVEIDPRRIRFSYPPKLHRKGPRTASVRVTNIGVKEIDISSASIEPGPRAAQFSVGAPLPANLLPGDTALIKVVYTPFSASDSATLLIDVHETGETLVDTYAVDLRRVVPKPQRPPRRKPNKRTNPRVKPKKVRPKKTKPKKRNSKKARRWKLKRTRR